MNVFQCLLLFQLFSVDELELIETEFLFAQLQVLSSIFDTLSSSDLTVLYCKSLMRPWWDQVMRSLLSGTLCPFRRTWQALVPLALPSPRIISVTTCLCILSLLRLLLHFCLHTLKHPLHYCCTVKQCLVFSLTVQLFLHTLRTDTQRNPPYSFVISFTRMFWALCFRYAWR